MVRGGWLAWCALLPLVAGCALTEPAAPWRADLRGHLARVGTRNWIVIAEASFPAHSRRGVVQTTSPEGIPATLDAVLWELETTEHLRPRMFTAREAAYVTNDEAPGIEAFRSELDLAFHGHPRLEIEHRSLLTLLEDAAETFDVLVIRTPTSLPYASVFIELEHGYWDADSEQQMRARMKAAAPDA